MKKNNFIKISGLFLINLIIIILLILYTLKCFSFFEKDMYSMIIEKKSIMVQKLNAGEIKYKAYPDDKIIEIDKNFFRIGIKDSKMLEIILPFYILGFAILMIINILYFAFFTLKRKKE